MYRTEGSPPAVRAPYVFAQGFAVVAPLAADTASVMVLGGNQVSCYTTNGTSTGTRAVAQLRLIIPGSFGTLDGLVLVTGDDGPHGEEIWVVDAGPAAAVDGLACGRAPDAVRLEASVPRLGTTTTLRIAHGNPAAALLLGLPPVRPATLNLPAPGCALFVDASGPSWTLPLTNNVLALAVPPDPRLLGVKLGAQAVSGPNAQFGAELSNGLRLTLDW